jgi:hypothetical protein
LYNKCAWVAGIVQKFIAGKPITYDAGNLVAELVEVSGGRAKCRLCGRVVRLGMLKIHLRSKHCDKLLELLERHGVRRFGSHGRGGAYTFNIKFYCTGCGWSHDVVVKSHSGPPNIAGLMEKLGLTRCPACGKRFEVKGFEFR